MIIMYLFFILSLFFFINKICFLVLKVFSIVIILYICKIFKSNDNFKLINDDIWIDFRGIIHKNSRFHCKSNNLFANFNGNIDYSS